MFAGREPSSSRNERVSGNTQGTLGKFDFLSDHREVIVNARGESLTVNSLNLMQSLNSFFTKKRSIQGRWIWKGTQEDEQIIASKGDDIIGGFGGNDTIKAGSGDDVIYGGNGNDILFGGDGNDVLNGGSGDDTLIGGSGADKFIINRGFSVIEDFDFNEGDTLEFGKFITSVSYEQDGNNLLIGSDQGVTKILNACMSDFV